MSILVDKNTRVAVLGMTGRQGSFHTSLMREEGTNIVAGVVPGKGGQNFEGIPVYNTMLEARLKPLDEPLAQSLKALGRNVLARS